MYNHLLVDAVPNRTKMGCVVKKHNPKFEFILNYRLICGM